MVTVRVVESCSERAATSESYKAITSGCGRPLLHINSCSCPAHHHAQLVYTLPSVEHFDARDTKLLSTQPHAFSNTESSPDKHVQWAKMSYDTR